MSRTRLRRKSSRRDVVVGCAAIDAHFWRLLFDLPFDVQRVGKSWPSELRGCTTTPLGVRDWGGRSLSGLGVMATWPGIRMRHSGYTGRVAKIVTRENLSNAR